MQGTCNLLETSPVLVPEHEAVVADAYGLDLVGGQVGQGRGSVCRVKVDLALGAGGIVCVLEQLSVDSKLPRVSRQQFIDESSLVDGDLTLPSSSAYSFSVIVASSSTETDLLILTAPLIHPRWLASQRAPAQLSKAQVALLQ